MHHKSGGKHMTAIIFDFNKLQQEHNKRALAKKEQLIFDCKRDIINSEEQIRFLAQQINDLQSNIDMNYRLISKINLE